MQRQKSSMTVKGHQQVNVAGVQNAQKANNVIFLAYPFQYLRPH